MSEDPVTLTLTYEPTRHWTDAADVGDVLLALRALHTRVHSMWAPIPPHYRFDHSAEIAEWTRYLRDGPMDAPMPLRLPRRDGETPLIVEAIAMGSPLELVLTFAPYLGSVTAALGLAAAIEKYWNAPLRIRLERARLQKELEEARRALEHTIEIPPGEPQTRQFELVAGSIDIPDSLKRDVDFDRASYGGTRLVDPVARSRGGLRLRRLRRWLG